MSFFRQGTVEEISVVKLEANKPVDVYVEYTNTKPASIDQDRSQPALMRGVVSTTPFDPLCVLNVSFSGSEAARRLIPTRPWMLQ